MVIEVGDYVRTPSGFKGTVTQTDPAQRIAVVDRMDLEFQVPYDFDELDVIGETH